jgi:hypothetical protein
MKQNTYYVAGQKIRELQDHKRGEILSVINYHCRYTLCLCFVWVSDIAFHVKGKKSTMRLENRVLRRISGPLWKH